MREAIFVCGPEASGTRMLTEAFVHAGYEGDFSHRQRLDKENFASASNKIVFRRSFPHGNQFPIVTEIVEKMQSANYIVRPVIIFRDKDITVKSQLSARHVHDEKQGRKNIENAMFQLFTNFYELGLVPTVVYYRGFVTSEKVRENFFKQFDTQCPKNMIFFDGNEKYIQSKSYKMFL